MVYITLRGMQVGIDFTVPAFGALLFMTMPLSEVMLLLLACLLHESAHFISMWYYGCKPRCLRLSASGMELRAEYLAVCPFKMQRVILLAGAGANLMAALICIGAGAQNAALWQLSTGLFNLLPYRAADGGTLLYLWLEERLGLAKGAQIEQIWRRLMLLVTVLLVVLLIVLSVDHLWIWAMLAFLYASELLR